MPTKMSRVAGREDFPRFLNEMGLTGVAVEVGTHRGVYARQFLSRWKGTKLFCIDPWVNGYDKGDPASHGDRQADKTMAVEALRAFGGRVTIIEDFSPKAADRFDDNSLDFVYIDGSHLYPDVVKDMTAWWHKVKPGGVMAGHDIVSGKRPGAGHGAAVMKAAKEHAQRVRVDIMLVAEVPMRNWSFYMIKP